MTEASQHELWLRPADKADRIPLTALLEQPGLSRRRHMSGVHKLHPIDWSPARRTFIVEHDEHMIGSVELLADEDEPDEYELTVVLAKGQQTGYGARSGLAAIFYAFEVAGADLVWFWARRDNQAAICFAERMGFYKLNAMRLPSGDPADVFELDRLGWDERSAPGRARYLDAPVVVGDHHQRWRGEMGKFSAL